MQPYYVPDFLVKITGITLGADITNAVISLTVESHIDMADMFSIQFNNADLRFTDSALFEVGKRVEIYMGYVGNLQPMILGEIVAVSPSFPESGAPTITITGYDLSHRMRHNSPSRFTFTKTPDFLIASQIAAENLLIPVVDPTPPIWESVQQTGSDWALLKELADRNFFWVYVFWDKLYFRFPRPQTEQVVLEWGKNLSSFNPRLSTSGQYGIQIIRGYDYQLAQNIVAILPLIALDPTDLDNIIERLGSTFIEQLLQLGRHVIRNQPVTNYLNAAALAKSILLQLLQGLYEASGNCIGIPELRARDTVEIRGVGKRFSGQYTLSKVRHIIDGSGYRTQFEVSQQFTSSILKSLRKKIAESPSPNKQEKMTGVFVGKVVNNLDPMQLGRIQVSFPHLSDLNISPWARIATMMAGANEGSYFLPDMGDEVLVSFEKGDINSPVIVGGLWNGLARPPEFNTGLNARKMIQTKTGLKLMFDETPGQESLSLETLAGLTVNLSDTQGITIKDLLDNSIHVSPQGITINSPTRINLTVAGNSIEINASGVTIQGTQINLN
ncbi:MULTISPECIES: phage baseplate assembly protein V [unclassified Anabaena]|uniref:phage baseplate assembly protein V n=1 Tax=unclassified Anabaena TaxID=2619674 RepID=UPI00082AA833|nr:MULTISPECIES: phage baseplate assembly protein V [unclassified Anabaena]